MARLQILELPEGAGDGRPPFVLIIDQVPTDEAAFDALRRDLNDGDLAKRIGASAVLVFEETIDIPANQQLPTLGTEQGIPPGSTYQMTIDGQRLVWEVPQSGSQQESTGRPTHPDGTPYNYSEIVAEGWEHCDGCRTWGQWAADSPHNCPSPFVKGPATDG